MVSAQPLRKAWPEQLQPSLCALAPRPGTAAASPAGFSPGPEPSTVHLHRGAQASSLELSPTQSAPPSISASLQHGATRRTVPPGRTSRGYLLSSRGECMLRAVVNHCPLPLAVEPSSSSVSGLGPTDAQGKVAVTSHQSLPPCW